MRPIRLELKGFTSFRDPQEIEFTDLDLFAIVGPTGSGKSSLLDAITYALFGEVDRVGKGVAQLVSQGQPRMAVVLEFEVAGDRFRITRSTPAATASGQTKVLLQVLDEDGEWQQAGDGADRVREVNARLQRAIGLDYDAFTRSVLLPQGRFAEFLVGDAKDRREILTELLGLELFKLLAKRAGEIRASSATAAQAKAELLESEYSGVTPETLSGAKAEARSAAARERSLAAAGKKVTALAKKGERTRTEALELQECADQADSVASAAAESATLLQQLAAEAAEVSAAVGSATEGAEARAKEAALAADARAAAEREWGRATDLAAMRARSEELVRRREEFARSERELAERRAGIPQLEKAAATTEKVAESAELAMKRVKAAVFEARGGLDAAQHADLVAAVRSGIVVGEPCPVCGAEIAKLPRSTDGTVGVAAARKALAAAERELAEAEAGAREADGERSAAVASLGEARKALARAEADLERCGEELAEQEGKLADALGGATDPLMILDERLSALDRLVTAEGVTAKAASEAERRRERAERDHAAVFARVGEQRASLAARPAAAIAERAVRLGGSDLPGARLPSLEVLPTDGAELAAAASALHREMSSLADSLEALGERRGAAGEKLLAQAKEAIEDLLEVPGKAGFDELADAVGEAVREATAGSATATEQAARLEARLEASRSLTAEVRDLRERAARFAALAKELRADNIIEFLQLEALQLLAAGGSERLATLSEGRYRLEFDADEFFVVDTWNGEEIRSARTLSGGETFLASLALALALSEQVQALAVTERAPLESLFLDEGFGTLDPETLEIVVGAIEQLGGDGRLVCVITHVQELAIRLPSRIEVEKSPRGSRLTVVA